MPGSNLLSRSQLVSPSLDSGAVADGDAANYSFVNAAVRCLVTNNEAAAGDTITVRVNSKATSGTNEASASTYDFRIDALTTVDISLDGSIAVKDLSVFFDGIVTPAAPTIRGLLS